MNPNPGDDYAELIAVVDFPNSVTKWVLPEYVPYNSGTVRLGYFNEDQGWYSLPVNNTLTEIVFPKQMTDMSVGNVFDASESGSGKFINLHKITFGEMMKSIACSFHSQPLDSVIFLGDNIFVNNENAPEGYTIDANPGFFTNAPATTKVIVPCGKLEKFVTTFNSTYSLGYVGVQWQFDTWNYDVTWTSANFYEAECLNTLTVLSSDNNLGNAYSFAGCGFVTQTPSNTSATYSGNITLLALPKVNTVFTGWNDGNLDNPRQVNVAGDVTYTAQFAVCTSAGVENVQANAPLRIFPNPTNSTLNVELERSAVGTLALFDMNGKIVANQSINGTTATINLSAFAQGTYILRLVENGKASAGVKVVKE
jgi:hypothetical protein